VRGVTSEVFLLFLAYVSLTVACLFDFLGH
jgi:hypothetical protein